jgi:TPR repeat protein
LPSQRSLLINRLDEASDLQAVYADLRRQALQGSVAALNDLGWIWLNGKYWRADTVLAGHLLRMAALQGNAAAGSTWGSSITSARASTLLCPGGGLLPAGLRARMLHAAAALGDLYEEGVRWRPALAGRPGAGLPVVHARAERGEARCRFEVGYRLMHGLYVEADIKAALYWLELAAAAGVCRRQRSWQCISAAVMRCATRSGGTGRCKWAAHWP